MRPRERDNYPVLECKDASRTKQEFRDEVNINSIMAKARRTGQLVDPGLVNSSRIAQYGDFSSSNTFEAAQQSILMVKDVFESLEADVRKAFENDPAKMLAFVQNATQEELIDMGLAPKPTPVPAPEGEPAPEAPAASGEGA